LRRNAAARLLRANRASARVKEEQGAVEIVREPFAYVSG